MLFLIAAFGGGVVLAGLGLFAHQRGFTPLGSFTGDIDDVAPPNGNGSAASPTAFTSSHGAAD